MFLEPRKVYWSCPDEASQHPIVISSITVFIILYYLSWRPGGLKEPGKLSQCPSWPLEGAIVEQKKKKEPCACSSRFRDALPCIGGSAQGDTTVPEPQLSCFLSSPCPVGLPNLLGLLVPEKCAFGVQVHHLYVSNDSHGQTKAPSRQGFHQPSGTELCHPRLAWIFQILCA